MRSWKKKNKTSEVLNHLKKYKSINSLDAIKLYGATRLSAIIYNLRHNYGLNIVSKIVPFKDRYGTNSDYVDYILIEESEVQDV